MPFLDADLFDMVAGRPWPEQRGAWAPHVPQTPAWGLEEVPAAASMFTPATAKANNKQGHVRERYCSDSDSDLFAVPEMSSPAAKRGRPSSSFWCL